MKTEALPNDLIFFLEEMGIVDDIEIQDDTIKSVSHTLTKCEVWIPKHQGEEIPF